MYDFCGYYGLSEELILQYLISPTSSFDSFSFYGKAVHDTAARSNKMNAFRGIRHL